MLLRQLGIYGWDAIERFVLASIAGQFSTLMVGGAGTGKTEGIERVFMALERAAELKGEEPSPWGYRNASTAQIEDMTGFPLLPPMDVAWRMQEEGKTPQMIWVDSPQTVRHFKHIIADEINRIQPMTQNRWFSLVAERRIDNMETDLESIFCLMNPVELYEGTEPLDGAFADRFVWLLTVPSFKDMEVADQTSIAMTRLTHRKRKGLPFGSSISDDAALEVARVVRDTRKRIDEIAVKKGRRIAEYTAGVCRMISDDRVDNRRVANIASGIAALHAVTEILNGGDKLEETALESLRRSMVHRASGVTPPQDSVLRGAHEAHKHLLLTADDNIKAQLGRINSPSARVGLCIALEADQEVLSDQIMAAYNDLLAIDPVRAAGFSIATLSVLAEKNMTPLKNVLDELASSVIDLFKDEVKLPDISVIPGSHRDLSSVLSVLERRGQYQTSDTGAYVLLLANRVYTKSSPAVVRAKSQFASGQTDPAVAEYIKYGRAMTTAEAVLRMELHALHYNEDLT